MRCKCGFENAADAKFCGSCRAALGGLPVSAVPDAAAYATPAPVPAGTSRAGSRPISHARIAIVAALVVVAAAGYWWMSRPPGRYEPDNGGLYPINVNGKYGFMDRSGKTVIEPQFDLAGQFSEGLAQVRVGSKEGYINKKGQVVIVPQFDDTMPFRDGRAAVKVCCGLWRPANGRDTHGFIGKDGKLITSPTFLWVGSFSEALAPVMMANGTLAFVDRDGKGVPALSGKFQMLYSSGFVEGLAPAASDGKNGFIDHDGKWVIDPQFEAVGSFSGGLAAVRVGGKSGFVDRRGKFVINPQYEWCDDFYEGRALVKTSGAFCFIDAKGQVINDSKYSMAIHFSDGLAAVKTEAGWGFIDRTGKMTIRPQFDSADAFQNDLARLTVGGKEAYVTTAGKLVVIEAIESAARSAQSAPGNGAAPPDLSHINESSAPSVPSQDIPEGRKLEARDNINKGVAAFKSAQYPNAVLFFAKAVELDPTFATARLYLATAYMNQYIPGADSPKNVEIAKKALENFQKVLDTDPKNVTAVESIASLYYLESQGASKLEDKLARLEDARQWYQKLSELDPNKKQAFYSLGVIAWAKWYPDWNSARSKAGMKPDTPGPLKDKKVREALKAKYGQTIEDGIASLKRALEIDKEYDDAMAYLNLLYRERGDLADSFEGYKKDVEVADDWMQKALDTRKLKAERQPKS